jgi:hypothetical protein
LDVAGERRRERSDPAPAGPLYLRRDLGGAQADNGRAARRVLVLDLQVQGVRRSKGVDMSETKTIDAGTAAELFDSDDGERCGEWTRLADQLIDTGRWRDRRWLVVSKGEGCFGIRYEEGLYPWDDRDVDELKLTPLVGVPISQTKYLTEKQYEAWLQKRQT